MIYQVVVKAVPKSMETVDYGSMSTSGSGKLANSPQSELLSIMIVLLVSMRLLSDSFSITLLLLGSVLLTIGAVFGLIQMQNLDKPENVNNYVTCPQLALAVVLVVLGSAAFDSYLRSYGPNAEEREFRKELLEDSYRNSEKRRAEMEQTDLEERQQILKD